MQTHTNMFDPHMPGTNKYRQHTAISRNDTVHVCLSAAYCTIADKRFLFFFRSFKINSHSLIQLDNHADRMQNTCLGDEVEEGNRDRRKKQSSHLVPGHALNNRKCEDVFKSGLNRL